MSHVEWILQGVLLALLVAALPFALRLERGLAALRRDRAALADGMQGFEAATQEAQLALSGLRGALETQARQVAVAEALREDLRFLVERAEGLADRLEVLVREGRSAASPPIGAAEEAVTRSQAERDLLMALRMAR